MNPLPPPADRRAPSPSEVGGLPPSRPWHERLNVFSIALVTFGLGLLASLPALRGSGRQLDYGANIERLLRAFFPPDWSVWQETLRALGETFQIALCATALATIISIPLAALGARTLSPLWVVVPVRLLLNGARTIPSLIWALIGVAIVGANPLAGVIGLTFYSVGYLGKFISDAFESVDADVAQGLRAIGADRVQAFQFGLWPHARPLVLGHVLWMLEYNLRAASIIGYVGAGGLGLQLASYYEYYAWGKVATVLLFILGLVSLLDLAGEALRRSITRHMGPRR